MGELAHIAEQRAVRFNATTFTAFKVSETGRTYALGPVDADTIDQALNGALSSFALHHKETLLIREEGQSLRIHVFTIKQRSAPRYVHRDHVTRAVHDLYAAKVCSFDGGVVG